MVYLEEKKGYFNMIRKLKNTKTFYWCSIPIIMGLIIRTEKVLGGVYE